MTWLSRAFNRLRCWWTGELSEAWHLAHLHTYGDGPSIRESEISVPLALLKAQREAQQRAEARGMKTRAWRR